MTAIANGDNKEFIRRLSEIDTRIVTAPKSRRGKRFLKELSNRNQVIGKILSGTEQNVTQAQVEQIKKELQAWHKARNRNNTAIRVVLNILTGVLTGGLFHIFYWVGKKAYQISGGRIFNSWVRKFRWDWTKSIKPIGKSFTAIKHVGKFLNDIENFKAKEIEQNDESFDSAQSEDNSDEKSEKDSTSKEEKKKSVDSHQEEKNSIEEKEKSVQSEKSEEKEDSEESENASEEKDDKKLRKEDTVAKLETEIEKLQEEDSEDSEVTRLEEEIKKEAEALLQLEEQKKALKEEQCKLEAKNTKINFMSEHHFGDTGDSASLDARWNEYNIESENAKFIGPKLPPENRLIAEKSIPSDEKSSVKFEFKFDNETIQVMLSGTALSAAKNFVKNVDPRSITPEMVRGLIRLNTTSRIKPESETPKVEVVDDIKDVREQEIQYQDKVGRPVPMLKITDPLVKQLDDLIKLADNLFKILEAREAEIEAKTNENMKDVNVALGGLIRFAASANFAAEEKRPKHKSSADLENDSEKLTGRTVNYDK